MYFCCKICVQICCPSYIRIFIFPIFFHFNIYIKIQYFEKMPWCSSVLDLAFRVTMPWVKIYVTPLCTTDQEPLLTPSFR